MMPLHGPEGARDTEDAPDAALALDMLAALVASGVGLVPALELLGRHLPGAAPLRHVAGLLALGTQWHEAWRPVAAQPELCELGRQLHFVHITSAPTAPLLRATASGLRRNRRRRAEQRAAQLATRLVVPLGLCHLPAFLCLGIVPLVLALLPG